MFSDCKSERAYYSDCKSEKALKKLVLVKIKEGKYAFLPMSTMPIAAYNSIRITR